MQNRNKKKLNVHNCIFSWKLIGMPHVKQNPQRSQMLENVQGSYDKKINV